MSQLGRISGPLLKSNLIRDGVDLAFETDLLYLNVNARRIGINNTSPTTDLDVTGTTKTTTLRVTNQADLAQITISNNDITSNNSVINFTSGTGTDATVYHSILEVDDFRISGNVIATINSDSDIEIRPNGAGTVELQATTNVTGNLNVSGNINAVGDVTIGGNIVIGDNISDSITINASIKSDLVPEIDNTYDLGSPTQQWKTVYANDFYTTTLNLPELNIGNINITNNEITTTTGQDLRIDGNGSGGVRIANFRIVDNTITNIVTNAITIIQQTGTGYFKIAGTNGFVPPRGTDAQRPVGYQVVGMTRYNTLSKALEIWDGATWASPAGASGAVSEIDANDISASFALILG